MIVNSIIQGLTPEIVQARVNSFDAKPFLYGKYFPVKKINGFSWKMIQNQLSKLNVAADIHTDNGSVVRKHRPTFESAKGDIPFISISREMTRSEMKEYQTALATSKDADAIALIEYWGEDVDYCFRGVQAEIEYIAWALFSNAGKLSFTTTNNATFANEFDLDYDVDADMKLHTTSSWANKTADILGDLKTAVETAKKLGVNPKFAFINLNELYKISSNEQIIKQCSSFAANALKISQTPDLEAINAMLARQAWLNGIQLRVIDQTITREFSNAQSTSGNPFENNRLVLTETEILGRTQYDILQENAENVIRVERAHTIVKKYGTIEPTSEITIGQADAIPVLDTAYRNIYIKTDGQEWA